METETKNKGEQMSETMVMDGPTDMKEVLENRITKKIKEAEARSSGVLDTIRNEGKLLTDMVPVLGENGHLSFEANGTVKMAINSKGEITQYEMHPHSVVQAGEKLGIPSGYIRNLVAGNEPWQRELAARTLNDHASHSKRQKVLVRAVGTQVRAVLSDVYRRLDSGLIYESFLKAVAIEGGQVIDAWADETRSAIEVIRPNLIPIPTERNGLRYVAFGIRINTSDFGDGALELRSFLMEGICLNGAVAETMLRQIHSGSRIDPNLKLSERTYRLDTQTQASAIRDYVGQLFSKERVIELGRGIQAASAKVVDMTAEVKRLPKLGLTKGEADAVDAVLKQNDPADGLEGEGTLYKLTQGITAVARKAEARRKRELAEIAGALMLSKN